MPYPSRLDFRAMTFRASLLLKLERGWLSTKFITAAGFVLEYSRSAQPMALRIKNSFESANCLMI